MNKSRAGFANYEAGSELGFFKLSEHRARKRFGQCFLHDANIIQKIISAILPQQDDNIVEIGPGLGALSKPLLAVLDKLHVVEIDRDLIAALQNLQHPKLEIHAADALEFDYAALAVAAKLRVVGNLPYNISTPLLLGFAKLAPVFRDGHFMLQQEVVERICAAVGSSNYGRLSVVMQAHWQVENLFTVKRTSFTPAPKVTSCFMRIRPWAKPLLAAELEPYFSALVKQSFAMRRKTLANNLKPLLSRQAIENCAIDPGLRPQMLGVGEFIKLAICWRQQHG